MKKLALYKTLCREYVAGNISGDDILTWTRCIKEDLKERFGESVYERHAGEVAIVLGEALASEWGRRNSDVFRRRERAIRRVASIKGTWLCNCGFELSMKDSYGSILCPNCGGVWDFDGTAALYKQFRMEC